LRLANHLWTGGPQPIELLELRLCRDVYHCTPSQLRRESAADVLAHLVCMEMEHKADTQRHNTRKRPSLTD
jgi:hypothetical protein